MTTTMTIRLRTKRSTRGEATRRRIVEAAIDLFGEYGYERTSTRDIAARAGVNTPALQYYFENKEGVYRASAEQLAAGAWARLAPVVDQATRLLDGNARVDALIDVFIRLHETLGDCLFRVPNASRRLFFADAQLGHDPAVAPEIVRLRICDPLHAVTAKLIARITGTATDDPVTTIRAISLYGQVVMFHLKPCAVLALLGWPAFDMEKRQLIVAAIRGQTQALLKAWSATAPATGSRRARTLK
ncbi:CerR family C-terminal domain-containing protein [Paraburkholderia acidicola]|uniref:CerR family C-terminal domain-containing protein n=1 Tax=Paraburkholderia acidicola TaxID=1912599 RepID=A0ABV1LVM7_9BURK